MVFALAGLSPNQAQGYDFYSPWLPEIWGPGETMTVGLVITPLPDGSEINFAEVQQIVQEALDAWARVPTADIRWELGPIISEAEAKDRPDGMFPIVVHVNPFGGGFTNITQRFGRTSSCNAEVTYPRLRDEVTSSLRIAIHELGHCLGLSHPDVFFPQPRDIWAGFQPGQSSWTPSWAPGGTEIPRYWRFDPLMSYGSVHPDPSQLTADDAIGVSLLRPREGWLESTGSIVGRVTLPDGEGVPSAYVLATLLEPADRAFSVGVFANRQSYAPTGDENRPEFRTFPRGEMGAFRIEGLVPGDYQLLVRSPTGLADLNFFYYPSWAVLDLRQTIRVGPVRVRAGEEAGPVPLAVRRRGDLR